jgi:colanic acid biosynthesis glycosyl transferase WcaI
MPLDRDLSRFSRPEWRGKFVVLYAGNIGLSQDFQPLWALLEADERVVLWFHGDGATRDDLERRAGAYSDRVAFTDFLERDQLSELYAASDACYLSQHGGVGDVSVPSKLYSIFASGKPVLAWVDDGSETAETIRDAGGGLTVTDRSVRTFVAAARALADDPASARSMGERGRRYVETAGSVSIVTDAFEQLISTLVNGQR